MAYKTRKIYWPFLCIVDLIGYSLFFWKKFVKIPENPKDILVIRVDHIGDMILASSFFRNLKKSYPKSRIHVLCRPLTTDVAECIEYIDEVHAVNVPWFSRGQRGWKETRNWVSNHKKYFDLVFELHTDPRNIMLASMVGKYSVGYGVRGFGFFLNKIIIWNNKKEHAVDRNLDLLKGMSKKIDSGKLELKIENKYISSAKKKLRIENKKITIIHPITGRKEKNRSWDFWNKMGGRIHSGGVIIFGGSSQDKKEIDENISSDIINSAGKLSLKEYLALIKDAALVISTDTFVVHARAAFNKKLQVVSYPGYDSRLWGPYGMSKDKIEYIK